MAKVDKYGQLNLSPKEKMKKVVMQDSAHTAHINYYSNHANQSMISYQEIPMEKYYQDQLKREQNKAEEYRYLLERQTYQQRYGGIQPGERIPMPEKKIDLNNPLIWLDSRIKEITDIVKL